MRRFRLLHSAYFRPVNNPHAQAAELARFIPVGILRRLTQNAPSLDSPVRERFPATVLFADISGFTRLSEQLAARGPEGVEILTQTLNAYFGQLIEVIAGHGGDVVKFAGDALLALWRAESASGAGMDKVDALGEAVASAAQCVARAQTALREFTAPGGSVLRLRLGIGAGVATMFTVGGVFGRWESVVCGAPVTEATLAAASGEPGQVLVGPAAWGQIAHQARGEAAAEGRFRLRHVITQEVAYHLMPAGQRSQLHRAIAEWYEARHQGDLAAYYPLLA
jgi:class 3 adenylate cyclase